MSSGMQVNWKQAGREILIKHVPGWLVALVTISACTVLWTAPAQRMLESIRPATDLATQNDAILKFLESQTTDIQAAVYIQRRRDLHQEAAIEGLKSDAQADREQMRKDVRSILTQIANLKEDVAAIKRAIRMRPGFPMEPQ